jgi:hypothetical protein
MSGESTNFQTPSDMATVHVINVTFVGGSIQVDPNHVHVHIQPGESVQWRFQGIRDARRPEVRFTNPPLAVQANRGPFSSVSVGCEPDLAETDGSRIYTLTGVNADKIRWKYEYEAGVVAANGEWVGHDPIIENDGPPWP